jgi:hypothetical protein
VYAYETNLYIPENTSGPIAPHSMAQLVYKGGKEDTGVEEAVLEDE